MPLIRTTITLPEGLLAIIDEVAGPRGRSAYIVSVLEKQARRDRMRKVWRENFGALRDSTTWGTTDEEVLQTMKEIRGEWDRPNVWPEDTEEDHGAAAPGHDAPDRLRQRTA